MLKCNKFVEVGWNKKKGQPFEVLCGSKMGGSTVLCDICSFEALEYPYEKEEEEEGDLFELLQSHNGGR